MLSFREASPPPPPDTTTKGFAPVHYWFLSPLTPIICLRSRDRHNEVIVIHQTAPVVLHVTLRQCMYVYVCMYVCIGVACISATVRPHYEFIK